MRHSVDPESEEYCFAAAYFYKSVSPNAYRIVGVETIRNDERMEIFNLKKRQMERRLGIPNISKMLFHGTSASAVKSIINQGFLRDFNQKSAYGTGTYFARDAQYAVSTRYAKPEPNTRYQHIIVANVLIGIPCQGTRYSYYMVFNQTTTTYFNLGIIMHVHLSLSFSLFRNMTVPTIRTSDGTLHESMVDNISNPSIYVLGPGTDDHAVPTHVITFEKTHAPLLPTPANVPRYCVWEYQADDGHWYSLCGGQDCLNESSVRGNSHTTGNEMLGKYLQGSFKAVNEQKRYQQNRTIASASSWQTEADRPCRHDIEQKVIRLITLMMKRQLCKQLPDSQLQYLAAKVEELLYHRASSLQSYLDSNTLIARIHQLAMERKMNKNSTAPTTHHQQQHRLGIFQYTRWMYNVVQMEQTNLQTGRTRKIRYRDTVIQLCDEIRKHFDSDIPEDLVRTKATSFVKRKFDNFVTKNWGKVANTDILTQLAKEHANNQIAKRVRKLFNRRVPAFDQTKTQ